MSKHEREAHVLDPDAKKQTRGNWPSAANWPVGRDVTWNGVEPTTLCSRPVRFVVVAGPGEVSTCRTCTAREKATAR